MSEYQYYEFQAIDRPLTKEQMAELRSISTRATISSTRLVNVYHYGDFRGNPLELMKRYFDAHLYVANWGTHHLMLRLPAGLLDPNTARRYCWIDAADTHVHGDQVILDITSQEDGGGDWEDGEEWLPRLLPLRGEIASGDLRPLYLAWLMCAHDGELDDEEREPPVPPGLRSLTAAQQAFVEFLRLDDDLLALAAEASSGVAPEAPSPDELRRWIQALPDAEKNALLFRVVEGDAPLLRSEMLTRFRAANAAVAAPEQDGDQGRTVGELLEQMEQRAEERERAEAERKAEEQARAAVIAATARAGYLDTLYATEADAWGRVEQRMESKRPADYDEAVRLLTDLRDMSGRHGLSDEFERRLAELREQHRRKPSLMLRLVQAGLIPG